MFNEYLWKLYTESAEGQNSLAHYATLSLQQVRDDFQTPTIPADDKGTNWDLVGNVYQVARNANITNGSGAKYFFEDLATNGLEIHAEYCNGVQVNDDYKIYGIDTRKVNIYGCIELISHALYCAYPDLYFPFFGMYFNYYEDIFLLNNLVMPCKPPRTKFTSRACYYASINEVLQQHRIKLKLTPSEFASYINDFCYYQIINNQKEDNILPRVWLVIGGNGSDDFEFLDNATSKTFERWHANNYMRTGDIVIMYCMSPRKYMHSIWRAATNGFINPFFYYYEQAWITNPTKIPPISLSELKNNAVWSENGAVRANMQGAYRHFIQNTEYNELLRMIKSKGVDVSSLPQLPDQTYKTNHVLKNERDVELHLVEPLLDILGYDHSDWMRQMPLRMGRGECVYPDYAVIFDRAKNNETAKLLIETKFKISSTKNFESAFYQLQSYGLRLQSIKLVLASSEGIWIFEKVQKGIFSPHNFRYFDWHSTFSDNTIHKISSRIGKNYLD